MRFGFLNWLRETVNLKTCEKFMRLWRILSRIKFNRGVLRPFPKIQRSQLAALNGEYLLTSRQNKNPLKPYGKRLKRVELNVVYEIEGENICLAESDLSDPFLLKMPGRS